MHLPSCQNAQSRKNLKYCHPVKYDLQSLFGLSCVQLYSLAETPQPPPPPPSPAVGLIYKGAFGQPRRTTSLCDPCMSPLCLFLLEGVFLAEVRSDPTSYEKNHGFFLSPSRSRTSKKLKKIGQRWRLHLYDFVCYITF